MTKWTLNNVTEKIWSRLLIKRLGKEEDIKKVIIVLASKASGYITGEVICVESGITV